MEKIKFYEYAKCSTCQKAKKWLLSKGVEFEAIPIVEKPPSVAELKAYLKDSGLEIKKFFNTSGQSYRQGGFSEKLATLSEAQSLSALSEDGKLIKRPLLVKNSLVLVGFKAEEYCSANL